MLKQDGENVTGNYKGPRNEAPAKGTLKGKVNSVPAGIVGPFLRRTQPGLACSGRLTADGISSWYLAQDGTPVILNRPGSTRAP